MELRTWLPFACLVLSASASSVACTARDASHANEVHDGVVQAPLYGEGALAKPWPNGVVPVCFADPNAFVQAQSVIAATLANTWSLAANITFTGFGLCAPSGNQVTIVFSSQTNFPGATSGLGYGPRTMTLRSNDTTGEDPYSETQGSLSPFQVEVVREMGRVLGFANETQRPDNWSGGTASQCPSAPDAGNASESIPLEGGTYFTTAYDDASIMNPCRTANGGLSAGDVAGAQAVYGAPTLTRPSVPSACNYTLADCNPQTLRYRFDCAQPASLRPGESAVLRDNTPYFPVVAKGTSPSLDYSFAQMSSTGVFYLCIQNGLLESCSSMLWVPPVNTSPGCSVDTGGVNPTCTAGDPASRVHMTLPSSVRGGLPAKGTITLCGAAPAGGATVAFSSSTASAVPPSTITIPAGSTSASFSVSTSWVDLTEKAEIVASYLGHTATLWLDISSQPTSCSAGETLCTCSGGGAQTCVRNSMECFKFCQRQ